MKPVDDLASCRSAIEWGWAILAGHLFELRGYRRKEGARLPFNPGQWLTLGELKRAVGMGAQVLLFHRYRDDDAEGYWFAVEPNCVIASFPKDRVDNQDVVNVRCVDPYGPLQLVPWEFFCKARQIDPSHGFQTREEAKAALITRRAPEGASSRPAEGPAQSQASCPPPSRPADPAPGATGFRCGRPPGSRDQPTSAFLSWLKANGLIHRGALSQVEDRLLWLVGNEPGLALLYSETWPPACLQSLPRAGSGESDQGRASCKEVSGSDDRGQDGKEAA